MIVEKRAGSIGELLDRADQIAATFKTRPDLPEDIWYRGQSFAHHSVTPLLYRPDLARFNYREATLMDRFTALATPLTPRLPSSDWEWYFLARHHGVPSRLLDWTESLLTAVYFALLSHAPTDRLELDRQLSERPKSAVFDKDSPVVWVLEACSLNVVSFGKSAIVVPGGPRSVRYLPDNIDERPSRRNAKPIAVMPARANGRIVAQQGMFTVHGHHRDPLDVMAKRDSRIKLGRIVLDRSRIAHFLADLRQLGIHRIAMFPEPDSVASHVCWICQSTVPIHWRKSMAKKAKKAAKKSGGAGSTIKKGKKR